MALALLDGVSLRVRIAFFCMTAGGFSLPFLVLILFGHVEPIDRQVVIGCYTAPDAPSLDIRTDAIHIIEPERRKFSYVAEPSKTSYHLNVQPALGLVRRPGGDYAFAQTRGSGFYWPLLPVGRTNQDRLLHPKDYAGQFRMFASDGAEVIYTRVQLTGPCR